MKRAYSIPLITIIALSLVLPVLVILPVPVVAARGNPPLAGVVCDLTALTCTDIVFANYNVSVKAGEMVVSKIDGVSVTGYLFAIVFAINDTWIISFDGSWFDLYMSKDGYSALSPDDIKYAGPFHVVDLVTPGLKKRTFENPYLKGGKADYYIGKVLIGNTYYSLVIGPIPFDITAEYKYIKVFDGLATQVAVTRVTVEVLPSIALTPTWGPPCRMVTLTGVALRPNALLNLTYGPHNASHDLFANVWTDAKGRFSYTWNIRDLRRAWTGTGAVPSDIVTVYVWYNATGELIDSANYTQYRRSFVEVRSLKRGHAALSFVNLHTGAGNDTVTVEAFVFDTIVLAGAWWNPRDSVKIYIGGVLVKEDYPNETHGFFNTTFTVPELPMGRNRVDVLNAGVRYVFYIDVLPTLVLIPERGYIGDTVEVRGFGLPANSLVRIIWDVLCVDTTLRYNVNIVNGTTGPDGRFNVTVRFTVPRAPGGRHVVSALVDTMNVTYAYFTILPRVRLDPSTISADYGGLIRIIGEGLTPGVEYAVAIDNNYYGKVTCGPCGDAVAYAVGAGFRPGIHVVTLYANEYVDTITYALLTVTCAGDPVCAHIAIIRATVESIRDGVVYINTTLGTIRMTLDELRPMITEIRGGVVTLVTEIGVIKANLTTIRDLIATSRDAVITEIRGGIATIRTDLGTIRADLSSIGAVVTAIKGDTATIRTEIGTLRADVATLAPTITEIKGDVATIKTEVGEIKGKVVSIEGNVATVVTDVGTIRASLGDVKASLDAIKSGVDAVKSDVAAVKSDVATIKTEVAGVRDAVAVVRTGVDDVKSAVSPVPTLSAAIWLAVVFSLIAAILSAIVTISVRRKIAA
jgi:archaellum component FlaC